MTGSDPPPAPAAGSGTTLPPLVLRCRPGPRNLVILLAVGLLAAGTSALDRGMDRPESASAWLGGLILLAGAACAALAGRYGLARLVLDEQGFRLQGFLVDRSVRWSEVQDWRPFSPGGGPAASVFVVYGEARRRLFVPLIYEESQALPIGLAQRGFPRY